MSRKSIRHRRRKYKKRIRGSRSFWERHRIPILIGAGVLLLAAILVGILVIAPAVRSSQQPEATPTPAPTPTPNLDLSEAGQELVLQYKSINDPFWYDSQLVFSSGEAAKSAPTLTNLTLVDMNSEAKTATTVEGVVSQNGNLFEPQMNDKWIVYLDTRAAGGGTVCAYNRETKTVSVLREYFFAMPHISLNGDYAAFIIQTNPGTDKVYLCHLPTGEVATLAIVEDSECTMGGAYLSNSEVLWAEESPDDPQKSVIKSLPLSGMATEPTTFSPGTFAYRPVSVNGTVFYADGVDENASLMASQAGATPKVIDQGVINYQPGDGLIAYTKNDGSLWVYFLASGRKAYLTSDNTRGLLSSVSENRIVWYDITDGFFERDVVKYAVVSEPKPQPTPKPEESNAQE